MEKRGCLVSWILLFLFVASVYAFNNIFTGDQKTPDYYASNARTMFKDGRWDEGFVLVKEGLGYYPETNDLNELAGRYYLHKKDYDNARFYLVVAVRDNPENVNARQMLVNVEEQTKNYSSAICYVNELLEINPYWQGLWRKKIGLFRLQGNDVEADRLMKRLHQIYPNDSVIQRDYAANLEDKYLRQRKSGDRVASTETLYEMIEASPNNEEYYLTLTNMLLQDGNTEEALQVAGRGASSIPGSAQLVIKRASILAEEARYQEAMAYVQSRMRYNRSGALASFYNSLLADAAAASQMNDPYILYGKLYEKSKSREALDFMLNNSIARGYDEDALYYLSEAKKTRGETPDILYKEYIVYKRMGNSGKAYSLLSTLSQMDSTNVDLADELALNRLHQAGNLISDGLYSEAMPYLTAASLHGRDPEIRMSALNKQYSCYYEMGRYDEALEVLEAMHAIDSLDGNYVVKKTDILGKQGQTSVALALLDSALTDTTQLEMRALYVSAYEEIAVPYIKSLIEEGASYRAYEESARLLDVNPSCIEGLQYAIGMSDLLCRYDAYDHYVNMARSVYPDRTDFIVKQAATYARLGEHQRAVDLLRPWLDYYPHNQGLVGAFSENSEFLAYSHIKKHNADQALAVADTALVFDSDNQSLLLAKGTAFEALHQFDSAYHYQSMYIPSARDAASHERHLRGLQSRSFKNEISAEYLQGRYGDADIITAVATLSYTRKEKNDLFSGRINYAGRDGSAAGDDPEDQVPGGVGLQALASWEHRFTQRWSGEITAGVASKYFPKLMGGLKAQYTFPNDLAFDVHATYRRIHSYTRNYRWLVADEATGVGGWVFQNWHENSHNLIGVGAGVGKSWERFYLSGKADAFFLSSKLYANASAQFKYFPLEDGRTNIIVVGSIGSAPEADMIDNAMPGTFDKLNTSVGLGGTYMVNRRLSLALMGTWHTFYNQLNTRIGDSQYNFTDQLQTKYRNLFNVHFQVFVHF